MQLCCLSVARNTYQKNTIFSKTMQFRAVLSIDNQHEVLHGFSKNTLGPSGWPWMTANLAPCPTANPMKTSPLWNLCWQHGLTCAPTNAPHLFYWHTHGIKTECDVDITLSAYVTSPVNLSFLWIDLMKIQCLVERRTSRSTGNEQPERSARALKQCFRRWERKVRLNTPGADPGMR